MILVGLALTCLFGWILLPSKAEGSILSRLSFSFGAGLPRSRYRCSPTISSGSAGAV